MSGKGAEIEISLEDIIAFGGDLCGEELIVPQVYVFDIGGTLMEYKGMPQSWIDYYDTDLDVILSLLTKKSPELSMGRILLFRGLGRFWILKIQMHTD